jgi:hypothetical protein
LALLRRRPTELKTIPSNSAQRASVGSTEATSDQPASVDPTEARKTASRPSLMKLFKLPSQD